ncbi:hypothetical protein [Nocardia sp. CA-119907]|uniref:hypothetical protein n=1 Tax=Nocardia sp. CA-119907 TaxID=3239973 RepID=UPI003D99C333
MAAQFHIGARVVQPSVLIDVVNHSLIETVRPSGAGRICVWSRRAVRAHRCLRDRRPALIGVAGSPRVAAAGGRISVWALRCVAC